MRLFFFASALFALFFASSSATAQPKRDEGKPELMGDITLEKEQKAEDPLIVGLSQSINFFQNFEAAIPALRSGGAVPDMVMTDATINYLTGVYLFCLANAGKCPLVLESLLEIDIVTAKSTGKIECSNLKRFWSQWVKNGMEDRQNYLIKTGTMQIFQEFQARDRPRFLQCEKTIEEELSNGAQDARGFYANRYAAESRSAALPGKMRAFLQAITDRKINVFAATGSLAPSGAKKKQPPAGDAMIPPPPRAPQDGVRR